MSTVSTVGMFAATTRLSDDHEAIARARAAQCHQLRVLHNIHIRDVVGLGPAAGSNGPRGMQGRMFPGQNPSENGLETKDKMIGTGKGDDDSGQSRRSSRSSIKEKKNRWWCPLLWLILLYCFLGVTGLIIYLCFFHSHSSTYIGVSGEEGTYDAVI